MSSKKEIIMKTAEKLFAKNGYNGTPVRDIATKAKVNVSMISYYFGSKENLLEDLFTWRMGLGLDFAKSILENNKLNEIEKIDSLIDKFVLHVQKFRDFYLLLHTEQLISQNSKIQNILNDSKIDYIETYQRIVENGFKNNTFRKKPSFHFMHCTISGTIFNAMHSIKTYKKYLKENNPDFDEKLYENQYFSELSTHVKTFVREMIGYEL